MVDVNLFTNGTPAEKPWLNITANSVSALKFNGGPSLLPTVYSQYSQTSSVIVSNTVLGSLTDGATSVGSLTIPPLNPGSVVKIKAYGLTSGSAASANWSLYVDGKQATVPTDYGSLTETNAGTVIESFITIKSAQVSAFLSATVNNNPQHSNGQLNITWDPTVSHQVDIFAIFSAASSANSFTCSSFFVEISNAA